ncbi:cationic amino acid transporter 3-like, partial [Nilaparvata lugens]|uniref:cationic amino acid transporter 3-like n=1 Tax=Nilaparvata lugens TaxID=108931 RepID=UPI00193EC1BB
IGHMVGAGIYYWWEQWQRPGWSRNHNFVPDSRLTSMLAALCYAEFGTRIPKAGSAYVYTYVRAASVARAWSGYIDSMLGNVVSHTIMDTVGGLHEGLLGQYPDFLAFAFCIAYACVLGAATCFYAFVGFDSIATSGEEAKNPQFSIPVATILSLSLVCLGYVLVSGVLTLVVPYSEIEPTSALSSAFGSLHLPWAQVFIGVGALCGMTTTLLGSRFALPRCM